MHNHSAPQSPRIHRRQALIAGLAGFTAYALLREARAHTTALDSRLDAKRWIDRQEELAQGLHSGQVAHLAWHDEVNRLAAEVDVAQLMAEAARGRSTQAGRPFMRDPVKRNIHFVDAQGAPRRLTYAAATFTFGPDNVITPHAHKHLATSHMVVDGRVRIRLFDRVADRDGALLIRPTSDIIASVGHAAAMTTEKDNIHWFTPASAHATTFDVIIDGLDPGEEDYLIQPVDPLAGRFLADGTIEAPILTFKESMNRYTATM